MHNCQQPGHIYQPVQLLPLAAQASLPATRGGERQRQQRQQRTKAHQRIRLLGDNVHYLRNIQPVIDDGKNKKVQRGIAKCVQAQQLAHAQRRAHRKKVVSRGARQAQHQQHQRRLAGVQRDVLNGVGRQALARGVQQQAGKRIPAANMRREQRPVAAQPVRHHI